LNSEAQLLNNRAEQMEMSCLFFISVQNYSFSCEQQKELEKIKDKTLKIVDKKAFY